MVLRYSYRRVLSVPNEEDNSECVSVVLFILVLFSCRHQYDYVTRLVDHSILVAWQGNIPLHEAGK